MAERIFTPDQILSILDETPVRIATLTAGLESARLATLPPGGGWTANEVLAHLRACADVWGGYIQRILQEETPVIRAVSPRTYIHQTHYHQLKFASSLQAFSVQRTELLNLLRALMPDAWLRKAVITGAGRPLERTVRDYGERMARHEREHVRQVAMIADELRK